MMIKEFRDYFLNRSDDVEINEYRKLYKTLENKIDQNNDFYYKNISFIMLKPNAFLTGKIPEIIEELLKNEIYIFKSELIVFNDQQLDDLYMFVKKKYSDSWWVMKRLYELAPCLPAMVIGPVHNYPNLSSRIRDIVGPTTPIVGNETQIRYLFKSTHRIFNTIHATDDPASSMRENLVFFTLDDVFEASKAVRNDEYYSRFLPNKKYCPEVTITLDLLSTKNFIKKQLNNLLIGKIENLVQNKNEKLFELIYRLNKYVDLETQAIQKYTDLQKRFIQTAHIQELQRICLTSISFECNKIMTQYYRNSRVIGTNLQENMIILAFILRIIGYFRILTDDGLLMEIPSIETFLSCLYESGIDIDNYSEVLLLGCWAGAYNEFQDISLKWPLREEK